MGRFRKNIKGKSYLDNYSYINPALCVFLLSEGQSKLFLKGLLTAFFEYEIIFILFGT